MSSVAVNKAACRLLNSSSVSLFTNSCQQYHTDKSLIYVNYFTILVDPF